MQDRKFQVPQGMYRGNGRQMTERALSVFRYTLKGGNLNMQDFEKYILGRKSSLELGESTRYPFIATMAWPVCLGHRPDYIGLQI